MKVMEASCYEAGCLGSLVILGGLGRLANIGRLKIDPDVISHVNHHVS